MIRRLSVAAVLAGAAAFAALAGTASHASVPQAGHTLDGTPVSSTSVLALGVSPDGHTLD